MRLRRHTRMANQVAGSAGQLILREAADLDVAGIDAGDVALEACGGNDGLAFLRKIRGFGHGKMGTHN